MEDEKDNDVKIEIEEMLNKEASPWTNDCCIYKVPYALRKLNEDAFTPRVVSIGPFHYGNPRLQSMERHKEVYFQRFMQRISRTNSNSLVDKVEELESRIRRSYSEIIVKPEKKELIKLIVVDACFILELFLESYTSYHDASENDYVLFGSRFRLDIRLDLYLLENQLPFFLLEELFNLALSSHQSGSVPSLLELTFHFFRHRNKLNLAPRDVAIKHFTDLLRIFYLQPSSRRSDRKDEEPIPLQYTATELRDAGVKFRKNETNKCILDLEFSARHLRIPIFTVQDSTEIYFRNMVALEQCHYLSNSYITHYVMLIDYLINSGKDVDVLVQNGIIINWLGDSNAVAELFNSLQKNVAVNNYSADYNDICKRLNDFCVDPYNNRKATLRRDYCQTPWQTVASFAGILLLILTIIQTIFSILK